MTYWENSLKEKGSGVRVTISINSDTRTTCQTIIFIPMSKKDDDNPLEEIQKQLKDLLKNKNLQVAFAPFMQSMNQADDGPFI